MHSIILPALLALSSSFSIAQTPDSTDTLKSVQLQDVVIKASLVKHNAASEVYTITADVAQRLTSAYQLLGALPDICYNSFSNSISVRNETNVLVEIDGNPTTKDQIASLRSENISKVEVVHTPAARYTMAGYKYVIRIKDAGWI